MKKTFLPCLLALALVMPVAALAESEREEVAQRLELNQVSAGELAATGAVDTALAQKIMDLRDQLGSFQGYEDLEELNIPEAVLNQLIYHTTIQGIASDCNC